MHYEELPHTVVFTVFTAAIPSVATLLQRPLS